EPPREARASASVIGGAPCASILFSLRSAKNPMNLPSGDQKGYRAPFVPASGRAVSEFKSRIQIWPASASPSELATNATRVPSGDIAGTALLEGTLPSS